MTKARIDYRQYKPGDYKSYANFCAKNFGKNSYQANSAYLEWLYDDPSKSFAVALNGAEVVGIEHNFKAPVLINGQVKTVTVLHDLMVDEGHRGEVGFRLMQDSLKSDDYLVLPGSVGRLSRVYGRLGSVKFQSFWYRKFQFPRKFFRLIGEKTFLSFKKNAMEQNLLLGHSKEIDGELFTKALKKFDNVQHFSGYLRWRFGDKNSPFTFYVTDNANENSLLFVIGKRGVIPYARIFYVHYESQTTLKKIMLFVEKMTSQLGIPVILYSTFECQPLEHLGYRIYTQAPVSYVYSRAKIKEFTPTVLSFCSDLGFDGLNIIKGA